MIPIFNEDLVSQIPALKLLINMGYSYITENECNNERGRTSNVILENILRASLKKINIINYKNNTYDFSDSNIENAVKILKDVPFHEGYLAAIQKVYERLTMGVSLEQSIGDEKKSFTLKYIDFDNFENNTFHVAAEYSVKREARNDSYIPDIVCFINGIPIAVIECKSPSIKNPMEEAIKQHARNQESDGIRLLYVYSQVLLSLAMNDARFATTNTKDEFWAKWREVFTVKENEKKYYDNLNSLKNIKMKDDEKEKVFSELSFEKYSNYFEKEEEEEFILTEQDKIIYSLLDKKRLLELFFNFIVFDEGEKKIARYQQFFAVNKTIDRIKPIERGRRKGGVIWHTQGSGKSLTMVMLAQKIALEKTILNPKIILVTDRVDLDDQLSDTFKKCGITIQQANTGAHLVELLESKSISVISTVINKFEACVNRLKSPLTSNDIFVLIDEAHRTQYGAFNVNMQKSLPNACFISFTGTPLMKKEKNTADKFGGIIDIYAINQAVEDKAVVPLLFEGRNVIQDVNDKPLDYYFELISADLNDRQKSDLKNKFNRADLLNIADQKVYCIAWDISKHFQENWQNTGFKGQLVTPKKTTALKYKKYLDEIGIVSTEVVISPPDQREGVEDIIDEDELNESVINFWKNIISQYGSQENYERNIINRFKKHDEPEILIVVDKLLTGFDAPKNTVLYITKNLKEHSLLQAIARVNRVYEGKDYGYIIDYYGILGNLDQALTNYSNLKDFEEEDLKGTLTNVKEEIANLPQRYGNLLDIFKDIENQYDMNAYEEKLRDDALREKFYEKLSVFNRTFKMALSTLDFYKETSENTIRKYKNDSIRFLKLRASVKKRYSDEIDFKQYEAQIQKLIDKHIESSEAVKITELVNIFNEEEFRNEIDRVIGDAAKADTIASRTKKYIYEKMEDDPAFYKKFSELLKETIKAYIEKRISEAEYLKRVQEISNKVLNKKNNYPEKLKENSIAQSYYGIIDDYSKELDNSEVLVNTSLDLDKIIKNEIYREDEVIIEWQRKKDLIGKISIQIEDYLIDELNEKYLLGFSFETIDEIREKILEIAKRRYQ